MAEYISQITLPNNSTYNLKDSAALPFAGGDMTGTINRYYSADGTPFITVRSYNIQTDLFRIGHATSSSGDYTHYYTLRYRGDLSSPNNHLDLIYVKGNTESTAIRIKEDGTVEFPKMNKGSTTKPIYLNNGVITEGTTIGASAYHDDSYFAVADHGTHVSYGTSTAKIGTASAGSATTVSRSDHVHAIDLDTGDSNGQVKIAGTNVNVKGFFGAELRNTDWNTLITEADYYCPGGHNCTHTPGAFFSSGSLHITRIAGGYYKQEAFSTGGVWSYRIYVGSTSTWSDWKNYTMPASGTFALTSNTVPLTGNARVTGDIILYTSGTGSSPSLVFQRQDTIGGGYYDWRIRDSDGQLYFEDIGSHTDNTWTERLRIYEDTLYGTNFSGNAATATLLQAASNKINDVSTTIGESGWDSIIPTGSVKVWSQKFINTGLKYNDNGTDTSVTDAGNIVMWLTPGETTDAASLCMRIDGTIQSAGFIGNASSATKLQTARELYVDLGTTHDTNNKVTFDGSADKVLHVSGTLPIGRGGTGKTSANDAANALLSGLPTSWTATPLDDTAFIRCATNSSTTFGRAPFSTVWTYINNKVGAENGGFTGIPKAPTAADGTNTTQIATTAFVQNTLKYANALIYKGTIAGAEITEQAPGGALTLAANCGDTYKVSTAGFINGLRVEVGDMLICMTDDTPAATATGDDIYTTVRTNWNIIQTSEGTVSSSSVDSTDNALAIWDNTSGRIIKNQSTITYIPATDAELGSTKGKVTGLFITGSSYGNTAENLGSNKNNVFTYGDPGPQIRFGTSTSASELGAIIWSNNSSSNYLDSAFYFVGRKDTNNTEATVGVVTKVLVARTRLMVGSDYSNTSYVAYLNGATYINGTLTLTSDISGTGSIQIKTNTASSTITTATFQGASIIPGTGTSALARYLGSSTYPWKNVYAETFTGDLSGTASIANALANLYDDNHRPTNANISHVTNGGIVHFKATSSMTTNKPMSDGNILHFHWDKGNAWDSQLYIPDGYTSVSMQWRGSTSAGVWGTWKTILDNDNSGAGTNNASTLTWGTTYTIAKLNGTAIKFTTMAKPTAADIGAATSGHTHTLSIAEDTGTSALTLAYGKKYKLTAGGETYIFTMPALGTGEDDAMAGNTVVTNVAISADTTTNKNYALVFGTTASDGTTPTAAKTEGLQKNSAKFYVNPSTGALYATKLYSNGTEVSVSGHTHTLSIAEDTGTNALTLAYGKKYKLTAGGKTYIFTMPALGTGENDAIAGNTTVTNVSYTSASDDAEYPILIKNSTGSTTTAGGVKFNSNVTMNPSTSTITANTFTGTILKLNVLTGGRGTVGGDKGSNANPRYVPSKWYFNAGIVPVDGDIITIKVPVAGSDRGVYLSVDNQTTYYPVIYNTNSYITTHFGANACITLYFDSSITTKMYALNGQNDTTTSNVTGAWRVLTLYDSGNTNTLMRTYALTSTTELPILAGSTNTAGAWADYTSSYKNLYGTIASTTANRATINPSTGHMTVPGGITGDVTGDLTGNVNGTITQEESTGNYDRPIWFCDHDGTNVVLGKPGYNNNFKYNPSNRTIKFSDSAVIQTTSNNLTLNAAGSFYLHCASTAYITNGNATSLIFRRVNGSNYPEYARFNTSGNLIIGLSDAQNDFTLARILVENHDTNSANDIKGNSQMTISNSNGGNVGIELRRGALSGDTKDQSGNASWKISVESGEFKIKSDYSATSQLTNYGHTVLTMHHQTGLATFSNSVDISEALSVTGNIWGGSSSASSECDVGVRGVAGKIFFWSAASASGDKGIWIKNTDETNTSTLFTVNQSNQIKAMATIACQIKVAYTTASGNTSIPMIELTDSAAAGTAAANSWMRGLHHIVTNLAVGGHTCFITGKALSQNKAAILSFNYNNASTLTNNTIGLGLYGNENLLIIDGNGKAIAKSFATDGTQAAQIYLGRTSLTNWIQTSTTSSISFCIHDTLNESNASLKITGSTLTCYSNEKSSLGTSTVQWNGTYSKFYVVDKNVTLQWNSTDQSLDFIFA